MATPTTPDPTATPPVTDEELVTRARAKDFGAFEQLVDRYEDKVYRLAFRFVRNETEAKEIVQDTFLSIWRKLDTFKGDAQFSSWLYRVATNAALMRLRAQRRHPEISTEETAEVLEISVPTVKTRLHRARIALRDAISRYFDKR